MGIKANRNTDSKRKHKHFTLADTGHNPKFVPKSISNKRKQKK